MTHVKGSYYRAGQSARIAAVLHITDTGRVTITDDEPNTKLEAEVCHFNDLKISPRLGNTPRYIDFPHRGHFETPDNDAIDRQQQTYRQSILYRWIHFLESHLAVVLLLLVLVSGFVWGSFKYGIPAFAQYSAQALPVDAVQYLGQGTLEILDRSVLSPSELEQEQRLRLTQLFQSYTSKYPDLKVSIDFRKGGNIGANAMALPDGHIIFTDELVELAQSDDELLAILGHEIGHLEQRHLLRRVIQDSMVTILFVMISGDVTSASGVIFTIPALLLEFAYSREFENEADEFAYQFLLDHQVETQHFANIMLRLMDRKSGDNHQEVEGRADGANDYFSTHPQTDQRIKRFIKQ